MTALPAFSDDRPTERRMRSRWLRPDDAPLALDAWPPPWPKPTHWYNCEDPALPFPEAARRYLRADGAGPMAHWAEVLRNLTNELERWPGEKERGAHILALLRYLERPGALVSQGAFKRVLALLPPVTCGVCGAPFWRSNERRLYCSDACRRDVPGEAACVQCGKRLPADHRRYCGAACYDAVRALRAAQRARPCARCGRPKSGENETYCSNACRIAASKPPARTAAQRRRASA